VRPGDVLFGKLRPYLAKTWLVDRNAYASTELLCIRPGSHLDSKWLSYLACSRPFIEWAVATSDGTKMPRTSWEKLGQLRIDVPSLATQRSIANYLDRETARIDALITAKRRMMGLLKVRCASVAQDAIDRSAPQEYALRRLVTAFVDYRGATPEKAASGVPLITATNVSDGTIDLSLGEQFVSEETYSLWMRRGFPESGDVLLTTEAPLGEVAPITDPRVALAQRIILLKPNRARVLPDFLRIALMSPRVQADLLSRASGSTVWGIRADRLRDVRVSVPSLSCQRTVLRSVHQAERVYAAARTLLDPQIDLLGERRQALIAAAVTGSFDLAVAA
jgi:type I restriction enzyme, S subunit